jgi:hypothetical protein
MADYYTGERAFLVWNIKRSLKGQVSAFKGYLFRFYRLLLDRDKFIVIDDFPEGK